MTEFLQQIEQFHFLRPWWLLAFIPALILLALLWKRKASYGSWQKVISPHLLPHLLTGNIVQQSRLPLLMLALCWLLAIVAMAGPTWKQLPQAVQKKVDAQVIVLDLSLSMFAKDLPPSRLMRARLKLTDILNRAQEGVTALVVYSGTPHVVTPLTDDTNTILSMVNSLSPEIMPIKGNDPIAAIEKAIAVLKQGGLNSGRILLMTDGLPANFADKVESLINYQTPLSIMGIGTRDGAPIELPDGSFVKQSNGSIVIPKLDIATLKQASRQLGGRFSTITTSDDDIDYLLADGLLPSEQEIKETSREFDVWDETGHWLVLIILPFAASAYRKGWLGAMLLPGLCTLLFLAYSPNTMAFGWDELWQTKDQQGQRLLQSGQPQQAAEAFNDPAWKGSSLYKAEDYEAAEQAFSQNDNADAFYNLGNAQAKQQKLDEAITSYEKALALNPDLEDAKFNLDLVKQIQQQQQDQQQDGENSDQKNDDQQEQDDQKQDKQNENQQDSEQNQDSQQDSEQQDQSNQNQSEEEQQQQTQEDQQNEPEQENAQQQEQEQESPENEQQDAQALPESVERTEDQQALEQWLRRIPDDPGGLLRRKFERESQLRSNSPSGDTTW
jgi:Ca-activated chloride channel family protein